jgi:hypothetical protein
MVTSPRHGFWRVWTRFGALLSGGRGLVRGVEKHRIPPHQETRCGGANGGRWPATEIHMKYVSILCGILLVGSIGVSNAEPIRLAQSFTLTNCMMGCNATAASCQSSCLVPGTPPTGAATATSNATASQSCIVGCTTQQLLCQTVCSRTMGQQ